MPFCCEARGHIFFNGIQAFALSKEKVWREKKMKMRVYHKSTPPLLYINKDKRDEKASFICFFAPFVFINFFLDNLLKFIVILQPVIKIQ